MFPNTSPETILERVAELRQRLAAAQKEEETVLRELISTLDALLAEKLLEKMKK